MADPGMISSQPVSPLAEYLDNTLYSRWQEDRQDLETKWEQNDCTIRRIRQTDWKSGEGNDWRSDAFVAVVKQKWLAGTALVLDYILEGGMLGFNMKPNAINGREPTDEEIEEHADEIDDAVKSIRTQFEYCRMDKQTIRAILSAGKYGTAWGHYYVKDFMQRRFVPVQQEYEVDDPSLRRYEEIVDEIESPAVEWVSVWEMFCDQTVDDVKDMEGLCREQNVRPYQLRQESKSGPGWIEKEIDRAIEEAKGSESHGEGDEDNIAPARRDFQYSNRSIKRREYWCRVPVAVVKDFEKNMSQRSISTPGDMFEELEEQDGNDVEIMAVTANGIVVRFVVLDEYEQGHWPFYKFYWEDSLDGVQGVGIADNGYEVQEMFNGSVNAYMDNKRLAGDVMFFYNSMAFKEEEGLTFSPGKAYPAKDAFKDMAKAISQIVVQDVGSNYEPVMDILQRWTDEETMIPKISQGAQSDVEKTAFETNQLVANAGKYLGGVIRNVDNDWTEPAAGDFHRYNMLDPEKTDGQGDYVVSATGFSSFEAKVIRVNRLMQLMQLVLSSPELSTMAKLLKTLEELYRANDLDPDEFLYGEEEAMQRAQELMQANQQPQEDPEKAQLEKQKMQADIENTTIDTQTKIADQQRKSEELKLDMLDKAAPQPPQPGETA